MFRRLGTQTLHGYKPSRGCSRCLCPCLDMTFLHISCFLYLTFSWNEPWECMGQRWIMWHDYAFNFVLGESQIPPGGMLVTHQSWNKEERTRTSSNLRQHIYSALINAHRWRLSNDGRHKPLITFELTLLSFYLSRGLESRFRAFKLFNSADKG
jgi:hypothetical protein